MSLRVYVRVRVFACVRARVRHYVITELEGNEGDRKQENKIKQKYIYIYFFLPRPRFSLLNRSFTSRRTLAKKETARGLPTE